MIDGYYSDWFQTAVMPVLTGNQLSALLLKPEYAPDLKLHTERSDVPTTAIYAEAPLANLTAASGVLHCDDIVFTGVAATATQIGSIVIIDNTLNKLVACIQSTPGLQLAPNGTDITFHVGSGLLAL